MLKKVGSFEPTFLVTRKKAAALQRDKRGKNQLNMALIASPRALCAFNIAVRAAGFVVASIIALSSTRIICFVHLNWPQYVRLKHH